MAEADAQLNCGDFIFTEHTLQISPKMSLTGFVQNVLKAKSNNF